MHEEKQEIFDKYAKEQGRQDFENLLQWTKVNGKSKMEHIFTACDLVQKAQQERIAEKVPYDSIDEKMILENTIVNEQSNKIALKI